MKEENAVWSKKKKKLFFNDRNVLQKNIPSVFPTDEPKLHLVLCVSGTLLFKRKRNVLRKIKVCYRKKQTTL